jgi:acyl carrier protein
MDTFTQLRTLMADILKVSQEEITPETSQDDVKNWDSLQHLNIMLSLEQEFDLTLDVDDLASLTSVSAILKHINSTCPSR